MFHRHIQNQMKYNMNFGSSGSLDGSTDGQLSSSNETLAGSGEKLFHSTMSLYRVCQFDVHLLGIAYDVNLGGIHSRDSDVQLIDKVEEAQLEGKIRLVPKEVDQVILNISKHGVKVMDQRKREVIQRHPLHTVGQVVYYIDSFFKSNIVLKVGNVGRTVFNCYVFQCYSEEQAQNICQAMKDVFDLIMTPEQGSY